MPWGCLSEACCNERKAEVPDGIHIQITKTNPDGQTHFGDETLPFTGGEGPLKVTAPLPATSISFRRTLGDFSFDFHHASRRQLVLVTSGGLTMDYGDGSSAVVPPGGFLVGEDTEGRGHITRALGGTPRLSLFAHLAEKVQTSDWATT